MLCVRKSSLPVSSLTVSWQPKQTVSYKTRWSSWRGTSRLGSLSWGRPGKCFLLLTERRWWYVWLIRLDLVLTYIIVSLCLQPFLLPLWHPADVVLCNCLWSRQSHAAPAGHKPWDQPIRFSGQQSSTASRQKEGIMCWTHLILHLMEFELLLTFISFVFWNIFISYLFLIYLFFDLIFSLHFLVFSEDDKPRWAAQTGRVCNAGPWQLQGNVGDSVWERGTCISCYANTGSCVALWCSKMLFILFFGEASSNLYLLSGWHRSWPHSGVLRSGVSGAPAGRSGPVEGRRGHTGQS